MRATGRRPAKIVGRSESSADGANAPRLKWCRSERGANRVGAKSTFCRDCPNTDHGKDAMDLRIVCPIVRQIANSQKRIIPRHQAFVSGATFRVLVSVLAACCFAQARVTREAANPLIMNQVYGSPRAPTGSEALDKLPLCDVGQGVVN